MNATLIIQSHLVAADVGCRAQWNGHFEANSLKWQFSRKGWMFVALCAAMAPKSLW